MLELVQLRGERTISVCVETSSSGNWFHFHLQIMLFPVNTVMTVKTRYLLHLLIRVQIRHQKVNYRIKEITQTMAGHCRKSVINKRRLITQAKIGIVWEFFLTFVAVLSCLVDFFKMIINFFLNSSMAYFVFLQVFPPSFDNCH